MAEDKKINLNETYPNAFGTIREDLKTVANSAIYWEEYTDGEDIEIYPDSFQEQVARIESELKEIREFININFKEGNNSFDVRLTRTELALNRRPYIDNPDSYDHISGEDVPDLEQRLFELEQKFLLIKQRDYYEGVIDSLEEINKYEDLPEIIEQLNKLKEDIGFYSNLESEITNARITTSGNKKETLGERLDEDFQYLHDLIKDVNYHEAEGYIIKKDKTIAGWTKDLILSGRTDYNVAQGDTTSGQILPFIPKESENESVIRSIEVPLFEEGTFNLEVKVTTSGEPISIHKGKSASTRIIGKLPNGTVIKVKSIFKEEETGLLWGGIEYEYNLNESGYICLSYCVPEPLINRAVNIGSIQGYTYNSLIDKDIKGTSLYTPPRSTSYVYEGTDGQNYIRIKSIEGATIQDVTTSSFPEEGTIMPFLPSDGEFSFTNNHEEGEVTLGSIKGKLVKNEIIDGETSHIVIGVKPEASNIVTFDESTNLNISKIQGNMIENVIVGDSYSAVELPLENVTEELTSGDKIYVDSIEGKSVINLLANCDTTPLTTEITSRLDVTKSLLDKPNKIFAKEGRFREFNLCGNTMTNIGLKPKEDSHTIYENSFTPIDIISDKEETEVTKLIIKGRTYENVLKPIGETERIERFSNENLELEPIKGYKWIDLETETPINEFKIKGNEISKFVELRTYYANGSYDSIRPIQPIELLSKDDIYDEIDIVNKTLTKRLIKDESGQIIEISPITNSIKFFGRYDTYFYGNEELPDGTKDVYNIISGEESINLYHLTFDGTQRWVIKTIAKNKDNTAVFNFQLPTGLVFPSENNIKANFNTTMFEKSIAGNNGTNAIDKEAISITKSGLVELRIEKAKIGGSSNPSVSDLNNYLAENNFTITVKYQNPIVSKVPYSEVKDKYNFKSHATEFYIQDGYQFEAICDESLNPCIISMILPTYNRYPIPKSDTDVYTLVSKGNYLNGNTEEFINGNKVLVDPEVIYLKNKEPEVMLLKGDISGDYKLNTRFYKYGEKIPYNLVGTKLVINEDTIIKLDSEVSEIHKGKDITFEFDDKELTTTMYIELIGNNIEIAEFEVKFTSLHRFEVIGHINENNATEYTIVDVTSNGENDKELIHGYDIEERAIYTEKLLQQPMLFEGNYLRTHFLKYFDGMQSVENPIVNDLHFNRIMRGFEEYRDKYNYNTKEFTKVIDSIILNGSENWITDGEIKKFKPDNESWNNRPVNIYKISNKDAVYIDGDYICLNQDFELSSENTVEILFVVPESVTFDDYTNFPMPEFDGSTIEIDGSIVPPVIEFKSRSHNYFENVKGIESGKTYTVTSECEGDGQLLICGNFINGISNLEHEVFKFEDNCNGSKDVVFALGFNNIRNLAMYEDEIGTNLYGLDSISSVGDNGILEVYTIGRNKLDIEAFTTDGDIIIESDLIRIRENGTLTTRLELENKNYVFSFETLIGSGIVSLKVDGRDVENIEFGEGKFTHLIPNCNIVDISILTYEDMNIIIHMQLVEEKDQYEEFESFYRSGYSIRLLAPLMSISNECKDILEISPDSFYNSIIRRNIGRLIADKWVEVLNDSGKIIGYKCDIGVQLSEYRSNYSFELEGTEIFIERNMFLTLDLEREPLIIIYKLNKPIIETVMIEPMNMVFDNGVVIANKDYDIKIHEF